MGLRVLINMSLFANVPRWIREILEHLKIQEICDKAEVTTKDFYRQRQITDIFTIDVNKVEVSDEGPCNNGNNCRYIVGYQVDGGTGTTVYQDA